MRDLDATQQTSPEPVSRMSFKTTHPPNENDNIFKQLDKHICGAKFETLTKLQIQIFNFKVNETRATPSIKILPTAL
jgi:hypothetical protein